MEMRFLFIVTTFVLLLVAVVAANDFPSCC
jgi:hypothetical protein